MDKLTDLLKRMKNFPINRKGVGNWVVVNQEISDAINGVSKIHDRRKKLIKIIQKMRRLK